MSDISESKLVESSIKVTLDDCYLIGSSINLMLLSTKFRNIKSPLLWFCSTCGHKFSESYYNIKVNNKGCLKCSYRKFNKNK